MAYADKRFKFIKTVGAAIADNTDIAAIIIPAGKEVQIFHLQSYTRTKSPTANAKIELCDASNNILASVSITQNNGTLAEASETASNPVVFTNTSTSDVIIKLRTDQATGAGCDVDVQLDMQDPGAK